MLARSGQLPTRGGWAFEPKWDGFRALVRSGDDYEVRSRRGWRMGDLLPEFATLPVTGVFDGELGRLRPRRPPLLRAPVSAGAPARHRRLRNVDRLRRARTRRRADASAAVRRTQGDSRVAGVRARLPRMPALRRRPGALGVLFASTGLRASWRSDSTSRTGRASGRGPSARTRNGRGTRPSARRSCA